jgi:hypothetical protein
MKKSVAPVPRMALFRVIRYGKRRTSGDAERKRNETKPPLRPEIIGANVVICALYSAEPPQWRPLGDQKQFTHKLIDCAMSNQPKREKKEGYGWCIWYGGGPTIGMARIPVLQSFFFRSQIRPGFFFLPSLLGPTPASSK